MNCPSNKYKIALLSIGLFFAVLYTACQNQVSGIKKPSNSPLSEEQLVLILTDIHTAQAAEQVLGKQDTLIRNTLPEYYAEILCRHQVSADDLEQSFSYYAAQPEKFNKLYDLIQARYHYIEGTLKMQASKEPPPTAKPAAPNSPAMPKIMQPLNKKAALLASDSIKQKMLKQIKLANEK